MLLIERAGHLAHTAHEGAVVLISRMADPKLRNGRYISRTGVLVANDRGINAHGMKVNAAKVRNFYLCSLIPNLVEIRCERFLKHRKQPAD